MAERVNRVTWVLTWEDQASSKRAASTRKLEQDLKKQNKALEDTDKRTKALSSTQRKATTETDKLAASSRGMGGAANVMSGGLSALIPELDKHEKATRKSAGASRLLSEALKLIKPAGIVVGLGLAAQAMSAASAGAVALTGALAPLGGALAAYPSLILAVVQGLGTWKLATHDLGQALSGNAAALKRLTPEAKKFVEDFRPRLQKLQETAQKGIFKGIAESVKEWPRVFNVVERVIGRTSTEMGNLIVQGTKLVSSPAFSGDLETIGNRNVKTIHALGTAGLNLVSAFRHIIITAGPLVDWMGRVAVRLTHQIDLWAAAGRASGRFGRFFEQTRAVMQRLGSIFFHTASGLLAIVKAGQPLGNELLGAIDRVAKRFDDWTHSLRGRNALAQYFREARPALFELGKLVGALGGAFLRLGRGNQVAPLLRTVRTQLVPAFEKMIDSTTRSFGPAFIDALVQVTKLFTTLAGSSGVLTSAVKLFGELLKPLNWIIDNVPGVGAALSSLIAFGGLVKIFKIGATITGLKDISGLLGKLRGQAATTAAATAAAGAAPAAGGGLAQSLIGSGRTGVAGRLQSALQRGAAAAGPIAGGIFAGFIARDVARDLIDSVRNELPKGGGKDAVGRFENLLFGTPSQRIASFKRSVNEILEATGAKEVKVKATVVLTPEQRGGGFGRQIDRLLDRMADKQKRLFEPHKGDDPGIARLRGRYERLLVTLANTTKGTDAYTRAARRVRRAEGDLYDATHKTEGGVGRLRSRVADAKDELNRLKDAGQGASDKADRLRAKIATLKDRIHDLAVVSGRAPASLDQFAAALLRVYEVNPPAAFKYPQKPSGAGQALGGRIYGGSGMADDVPALLSRNEFVVTPGGESMLENMTFPGVLNYIEGVQPPAFARGGRVRRMAKGGFPTGKYETTAYGPPWGGIEGQGSTKTGIDLHNAPHKLIVAVDPSVIPLHSKVIAHPNPFNTNLAFAAEDIGGAIKGRKLDFYDWRGRESQNRWGRRNVNVSHGTGKGVSTDTGKDEAPGTKKVPGPRQVDLPSLTARQAARMLPDLLKGIVPDAFSQGFALGLGGASSIRDTDLIASIVGGGAIPTSRREVETTAGGGAAGGVSKYPLARVGKFMGGPHQGTHTRGDWQSDNAVDLGVPVGTSVLASLSGSVSRLSGHKGGSGPIAGYSTTITGGGRSLFYAHQSSRSVREGQKVHIGDVIGKTGSANGVAHLHFAARPPGSPFDYMTHAGGRKKPPKPKTSSGGGGGGGAPTQKGLAHMDGKPIAGWIKPYLVWGKGHGWHGSVTSGYRTYAEQKRIYDSGVRPAAKPGTSNHEGINYPRGAVDVSDASGLNSALRSYSRHLLVWAGAKDPVHFSHPHGGSYRRGGRIGRGIARMRTGGTPPVGVPTAKDPLSTAVRNIATASAGATTGVKQTLEELAQLATQGTYLVLQKVLAGVRAAIIELAKGGLTKRERVETRRLQEIISVLEGEAGRRVGAVVSYITEMVRVVQRQADQVDRAMRLEGVDPGSVEGLTKGIFASQTIADTLTQGLAPLQEQLSAALAAGATDDAKSIQDQIDQIMDAISDATIDVAEKTRAIAVRKAQDTIDYIQQSLDIGTANTELAAARARVAGVRPDSPEALRTQAAATAATAPRLEQLATGFGNLAFVQALQGDLSAANASTISMIQAQTAAANAIADSADLLKQAAQAESQAAIDMQQAQNALVDAVSGYALAQQNLASGANFAASPAGLRAQAAALQQTAGGLGFADAAGHAISGIAQAYEAQAWMFAQMGMENERAQADTAKYQALTDALNALGQAADLLRQAAEAEAQATTDAAQFTADYWKGRGDYAAASRRLAMGGAYDPNSPAVLRSQAAWTQNYAENLTPVLTGIQGEIDVATGLGDWEKQHELMLRYWQVATEQVTALADAADAVREAAKQETQRRVDTLQFTLSTRQANADYAQASLRLRRGAGYEGSPEVLRLQARTAQAQVSIQQQLATTYMAQAKQLLAFGDLQGYQQAYLNSLQATTAATTAMADAADALRSAAEAEAQLRVDATEQRYNLDQARLQGIELQQQLAGTFDTGGAVRASFITKTLIPDLQKQLAAMQAQLVVARQQGDQKLADQIALAIANQQNAILQAQLDAQQAIKDNTDPLTNLTGPVGFEYKGQQEIARFATSLVGG